MAGHQEGALGSRLPDCISAAALAQTVADPRLPRFTILRLILSLHLWRVLWILTVALFLTLGWHLLFNLNILARGGIYFAWCFVQQLIYQSVVYTVLRKSMKPWPAALISGFVFALLHIPNPVLIVGTLVWGVVSSLLFEDCRTVLGLALLQVMFSSTLMWLTPVQLHHRFRVGPSYYLLHPVPSP